MRNVLSWAVALCFILGVISGCNSSVSTNETGGVTSNEDPRIVKTLLDDAGDKGKGDVEVARQELNNDSMTPDGGASPAKMDEPTEPAKSDEPAKMDEPTEPAKSDEPAKMDEPTEPAKSDEPAKMDEPTEPAKSDETEKSDTTDEAMVPKTPHDASSVELVPETPKTDAVEPVLDAHKAADLATVADEHKMVRLIVDGPKRCMACDEVSDLTQCVSCGHHHKKSAACPTNRLEARCESCYGKNGETVVAYPADAPCGACGVVHSTGPHCPHCELDANNKK